MTAEPLSPEQRAHDVATFLNLPDDGIAQHVITAAIRAAETAAVARCVETLRDMGMHETALMLRAALEEADNVR